MGFKADILKKIKIEPQYNKGFVAKHKVIGVKGVKEGMGSTTLLNHLAVAIASKNLSVCVLDLDFASPNTIFSTPNTFSILAKLNRQQESIMNIINQTDYASISYIGPNLVETVVDYMPMLIDEAFLNSRGQALSVLISELTKKFDIILVDMPADVRIPECVLVMNYCDIVYTLCKIEPAYLSKLQRDTAILSAAVPAKCLNNIINVYEDIEAVEIYKAASKDYRLVTEFPFSKSIANSCLNNKIRHIRKQESCGDIEELMYYTAIKDIINDMRSEEHD